MSRRRRLPAPLALLGAGAVLLAGCASGTPGEGVASDAATPRAAAAPSKAASSPRTSPAAAAEGLAAPAPQGYVPPAAGPDGLPPVVDRIETDEKVVFLTIDDGWHKNPDLVDLLREYGVDVTVFATNDAIKDDPGYFRTLQDDGSSIQNHSLSHPALKNAGYATNEREICGASDIYEKEFGTRPWLLRPPFGSWSPTTQQAAKACGIRYLVMWSVSQPGRYLRFAEGSHLRPGDIILLHFDAKTPEYLARTLRLLEAGGWKVGRLEDYLAPA